MFRMDDGIAPRDLKIDAIRSGLREIREKFLECVKSGKKREICHAIAANELMGFFGSLLPRVIYDGEYRRYILVGSEGNLLILDVDVDVVKLVDIATAITQLLK
ncbi:MAG: hypothetical protein ABWJ97_00915 [Thermoproteus sp.]